MASKKSVANARRRAARARKLTQTQVPTPTTYHNIFSTQDGKVIKFEPLSGYSWLLSEKGWQFIPTLVGSNAERA